MDPVLAFAAFLLRSGGSIQLSDGEVERARESLRGGAHVLITSSSKHNLEAAHTVYRIEMVQEART